MALIINLMGIKDKALIAKIFFCIGIFILSSLAGILPAKWERIKNSKLILSLANCFSAGIFISLAFMHILPEVLEHYNEEVCEGKERCFPWPFLIVLLGYSMILMLDKVAFSTKDIVAIQKDT